MIRLTKIFRFETAHAILGYQGACANIHGHSYELHVTIAAARLTSGYIGDTGIIMDFKDLKKLVNTAVVKQLDHKLVLSKAYLATKGNAFSADELLVFEAEPSAENLLIFIKDQIIHQLPEGILLKSLTLWETRDSYAEWQAAE